jgi:ABC-type uncharacterized transport system substrate-binding protein
MKKKKTLANMTILGLSGIFLTILGLFFNTASHSVPAERRQFILGNIPIINSDLTRIDWLWGLLIIAAIAGLFGTIFLIVKRFPTLDLEKQKQVLQLPIMISLICLGIFFAVANIQKPRLLVIHSYATDFAWVRDINQGLNRVLAKQPYSVQYHYMDTKRNPSQEFKEKATRTTKRIIEEWQPHLVIAIDDNAQLAAKDFINHPNMKIVFSGVNAEAENYGYDTANNVTGILERIPFGSLKDAFLQILPSDRQRIVHYSDDSETSVAIHKEMDQFSWQPINVVEHKMMGTFEEWQQAIQQANQKADFLMVTHYHTLRRSAQDPRIVSPKEVMQWTIKNSPIPDIGCWGFYVSDGGMVALGVSPYEQGEVAAKMAVDILSHGKNPQEIPYFKSQLYVIYARESRLQKYGVKLPSVYEAFAHATNNYYN